MFVRKIQDYEFTVFKKDNYWVITTTCVGAAYIATTTFAPAIIENENQVKELFNLPTIRVVDVAESIYLLIDVAGSYTLNIELRVNESETAEVRELKKQLAEVRRDNEYLRSILNELSNCIYPRSQL